MKEKIVYFDKPGADNTEDVLQIAKLRAKQLGIKTILVASTTGNTAVRASEIFEGMKVVAVSHHAGARGPNIQELTERFACKFPTNPIFQFVATHFSCDCSTGFDSIRITLTNNKQTVYFVRLNSRTLDRPC